jgi:uncharacterized membrane protein
LGEASIMHIDTTLLPVGFFWPCTLTLGGLLLWAAWRAPWGALISTPERMHLVAGGSVACLLLWLLNIHLIDGMVLHLIGITTLTLAIGWCFTILGGTAALVGFFMLQPVEWSVFPVSALLTVAVPATLSWSFSRALYRPILRHPFVYILGSGFLGGGLVVLVLALLAYGLFDLQGLDDWTRSAREFWPMLPLLMFSEGFINGMCVAALAIFYPNAMKTFDDDFYLGS